MRLVIPSYCLNIGNAHCDNGDSRLLYFFESLYDLNRQLVELYQTGVVSSDSTIVISTVRYYGKPTYI